MTNNTLQRTLMGLKIYNALMSLLYLCILCFMVSMPLLFDVGLVNERQPQASENFLFIVIMAIVIIPFFLLFAIGFMFVDKQKKWAWIYQIVLVSLGFTSILTILPCVLLLIGLVSDEVKTYYHGDTDS
jgi:hypothetical protein